MKKNKISRNKPTYGGKRPVLWKLYKTPMKEIENDKDGKILHVLGLEK